METSRCYADVHERLLAVIRVYLHDISEFALEQVSSDFLIAA